MASNAATKNGLVLSSLPAASGILVRSPRATTECEFDLASNPDRQTGSNPGSQMRGLKMPWPNRHHEEPLSCPTHQAWCRARSTQGQAAARRPQGAGLDL